MAILAMRQTAERRAIDAARENFTGIGNLLHADMPKASSRILFDFCWGDARRRRECWLTYTGPVLSGRDRPWSQTYRRLRSRNEIDYDCPSVVASGMDELQRG